MRDYCANARRRLVASVASAAVLLLACVAAHAEQAKVTVSTQFGINYLPMQVMKHDRLIEKHAAALGLGQIDVAFVQFSGGATTNEALLSGSVDVAALGVPPMIQIWNATAGTRNAVKGIAVTGALPFRLNSINPKVLTIKDFTDEDRIAVPAIKVSLQAVLLQMASATAFGEANYTRLDALTVSMAHPDAFAALMSGGRGSINAHFAQSPFQDEELANPNVHTVLTSYDVLGGPASGEVVITTSAFHDRNPTLYRAVLAAIEETIRVVNADKRRAAQIYVEETQAKLPVELIERIISNPQVAYAVVPQATMRYADFLHRTGRIKRRPASWADLFFPEIHDRPGS
jgi:NitT/TauT family transport system substrate-binding protein